ncbi:MAG TPA: hypothetical protein VGE06_11465, partial [Flavisolibacter sp.]
LVVMKMQGRSAFFNSRRIKNVEISIGVGSRNFILNDISGLASEWVVITILAGLDEYSFLNSLASRLTAKWRKGHDPCGNDKFQKSVPFHLLLFSVAN